MEDRRPNPIEKLTIAGRILLVATVFLFTASFYFYFLYVTKAMKSLGFPLIIVLIPVGLAYFFFFIVAAWLLERCGIKIYAIQKSLSDPIARRELVGIHPDGVQFPIKITIGAPYPLNDLNGNWRCTVSVVPLGVRPIDVGGFDGLQALSLAISYAESQLSEFVRSGGRVVSPDTNDDFRM